MPAIALFLAASQLLSQQGSLFERVVATPDPRNGYVDYVRAAQLVDSPIFAGLTSWYPFTTPQVAEPGSPAAEVERLKVVDEIRVWPWLNVAREISGRSQQAIAFVKVGNGKQVYDPRTSHQPATLFPELAHFKTLEKVMTADAYVKFADGNSGAGTQSLLEGLTFADKFAGSGILQGLVGVASTSIVLAAFERHLPQLSLSDCKRIEAVASGLLSRPTPAMQGAKSERDSAEELFEFVLANPKEALLLSSGDPQQNLEEMVSAVQGIRADQKQGLHDRYMKSVDRIYGALVAVLKKPERDWSSVDTEVAAIVDGVSEPALRALLKLWTPPYGQWFSAAAKHRTQIRLLDLHARVIEYRWVNGSLPETLAQAVGEKLAQDPLSGEPFKYELLPGNSYRLCSKGTPELGELELRYKRAPTGVAQPRGSNDPPLRQRA